MPACHAGGREFEPRPVRHFSSKKALVLQGLFCFCCTHAISFCRYVPLDLQQAPRNNTESSSVSLPAFSAPEVQTVHDPVLDNCGISLRIVRLDQLHPLLSGNKWFKLRRNLDAAKTAGASTLLSFGGAYSNHIHALAAAGRFFDFQTIGIIRGEIPKPMNPTLRFARAQGMTLVPVGRGEYRRRHDAEYLSELQTRFGDEVYMIPEGGANLEGVKGCADIAQLLADQVPDLPDCEIVMACGTATTLAGLVAGLQKLYPHRQSPVVPLVRGFAVLKGADFLRADIQSWLQRLGADSGAGWCLETDYHLGGYAKCPPELTSFIADFEAMHGIPLEPVYTGKLMAGVYRKALAGGWPTGSRVLLLHTGGLQARGGSLACV